MKEPFIINDPSYLEIKDWQRINPHLKAGFTTRLAGLSRLPYNQLNLGLHVGDVDETVISNRKILSAKLNVPLSNWVFGEQTHGTKIKMITDDDKGKGTTSLHTSIKGVDGLITDREGILCVALFADCVPLYFFDPCSGYLGIAHAGWKGTINRLAEKMVRTFVSVGVELQNLLVTIGPCISAALYEVDLSIINKVDLMVRKKTVKKLENDRFLLDLKQLNIENLLQTGVLRNNIGVTNFCTHTNQNLFYSYRRDAVNTGRMLGYLGYIK